MAYIGRQLVRGQNRVLDDISGSFNGSTTAFNLTVSSSSSPPASVNQLWIILGGILQKPGTDFTVADAVITFTTAPASTLSFWGMIQGDTSDINSPADASVTPSKIANSGDFAFPADVRFKDADGSHYVGLQAPSTVSSNLVWTLPAADGSANQLLKTDGSGALGWASDTQSNLLDEDNMSSNSATQPASQQSIKAYADTKAVLTGSTDNTICTVTGANAITGEANLTYDGNNLKVKAGTEGNSATLQLIADEGDDAADNWRIMSSASDNALVFSSSETTERLRIDSSGRLGLGVTPKSWHSNNKGVIQGNGGYAILGRSNNLLGIYQNFYYDSSDAGKYLETGEASAYFQNDGNHIFYTAVSGSGDASASFLEVLKLQADKNVKITDGDLIIGTSGHGIDFSATSGSGDSELFTDYERGTWTPTDGSSDGLTLSVSSASYVKVGDLVFVNFYLSYPSNSGTPTNNISGLPFAAKGSNNYSYLTGRVAALTNGVAVQVNTGSAYMHIYVGDAAQTNAQLSGKYVLVSGCYSTN